MCTVQVLLFAEAVRQPHIARAPRVRPGVCRKLFEQENTAYDPSNVLRGMEEQIRKTERERWNFDFEKEQPLPGRYQWVRVGSGLGSTPSCTSKAVIDEKSSALATDEVQVVGELPPRLRKSTPASKKSCAGAAQSKITDFLRKRKLSPSAPLKSAKRSLSTPLKTEKKSTPAPLASNRIR